MTYRLLACLLALCVLAAETASAAVPSLSELDTDTEKLGRLVGSRQVIVIHNERPLEGKKKRNVRFVTDLAVISAPAAKVREVITDFAAYPEFMPQIESIDVKKSSDGKLVVDYELEFELPVMNVGVDYTLEYTPDDEGISFRLIEGDLDENIGRWTLVPLADGRTLAAYTYWSDLASSSFGLRLILNAQPDLQLAIPVASVAVIMNAVKRRAEGLPKDPEKPKIAAQKRPAVPLLSNGEPPIPLDTMRKLAQAGTIVFIHPEQWFQTASGPQDFVFVSAASLIRAPLSVTKNYVTSFSRYPEFFEQVAKATTQTREDGFEVDWRLKLGFGIFSVPINYTLRYRHDNDTLPFARVKGDIEHIYGAWEFMEPVSGETLALYTTGSELGEKAPAILKLGNLVPNRQITVGVSTAAIIIEKITPWIEKQAAAEK